MDSISTTNLADLVGCSAKYIRDEIADGKISACRIGHGHVAGSRLRISAAEASRYLKSIGLASLPDGDDGCCAEIGKVPGILKAIVGAFIRPALVTRDGKVVAVNRAMLALAGHVEGEPIDLLAAASLAHPSQKIDAMPTIQRADYISLRDKKGPVKHGILIRFPQSVRGRLYHIGMFTELPQEKAKAGAKKVSARLARQESAN